MTERIRKELDLLKTRYPELEYVDEGQWVRIPKYRTIEGWNQNEIDVAFQILVSYPGSPPYGIYVLSGLLFKDQRPNAFTDPAAIQPPFGGVWATFSWTPDDGQWCPTDNLVTGPNLLNWVMGFIERFKQGV